MHVWRTGQNELLYRGAKTWVDNKLCNKMHFLTFSFVLWTFKVQEKLNVGFHEIGQG